MFRSDVFLSWGGRGRKRRAIVRGLKIIVYISLYIYIEREKLSSNDRKNIDGRRKVAY